MSKHLVVVGGGAAGFFCAVNAARMDRRLRVTLLEKTGKLLSKVKISGGGRCNVTHALFDIADLSKKYPRGQHFVKKTFHQFAATDTISWFRERGVALKTEADGRMFPISDSSATIVNCLLREAEKYKVEIQLHKQVQSLSSQNGRLHITLEGGHTLDADYVCVATGGYPKGSMFQWLAQTGHTIANPVPSLFTFNLPQNPITSLMGVSVPRARVRVEGTKLEEEGPVLITHWGLSGPAVLRLSAWGASELAHKNYEYTVHINWLPDLNEQTLKHIFQDLRQSHPTKKIVNHNFAALPNRLWLFLLQCSGVAEDMRFADLPARAENALARNLTNFTAAVKGKTTYKEEFVTAGGINLSEVDPNTLMSKKLSNLFFAGEALNIDGITGGFNFQNAWTTAYIAAKTIAHLASE